MLDMIADNHGVHTERGLRPDLKWTTLLSPPGDAGRYPTEELFERFRHVPTCLSALSDGTRPPHRLGRRRGN